MADIIVFISPDCESALLQKTTEVLRMHNIEPKIVFCEPPKEPEMTLEEIVTKLTEIDKTKIDLGEFEKQRQETLAMSNINAQPKKHEKFVYNRNIKHFNMIRQKRQQILFNRTRNK